MRVKNRYLLLLGLSISLTLVVPLWLAGTDAFAAFGRLPAAGLAGLLALLLMSWLFNGWRTRLLLHLLGKRIGLWAASLIAMATEFAGVATPASAGMPATYAFLLTHEGLTFGQAMGMVSIIVFFDLVFFGSLMLPSALGLALTGSSQRSPEIVALSAGVVACGTVMVWALYRYHRAILHGLGRVVGRLPWLARYRYRLGRSAVEFLRALRMLRRASWRERIGLYLMTVGYWAPRYCVLVVAVALVADTVPLAYLFLMQGLLNLGGQMIVIPGGGGGVDAAYAVMTRWFLDAGQIAFTLLLWRACTFYWYLVVGGPIFLLETGGAAQRLLFRHQARG